MKLEKPFYVEQKVSRFAMMAVDYRTLDEAESAAQRADDCDVALVWDCTNGPVGVLRAKYARGRKVE